MGAIGEKRAAGEQEAPSAMFCGQSLEASEKPSPSTETPSIVSGAMPALPI